MNIVTEKCNFCYEQKRFTIRAGSFLNICLECSAELAVQENKRRNKRASRIGTSNYCCAWCGCADIIDFTSADMYTDKTRKFVRCKKCGYAGAAGSTTSRDFFGDSDAVYADCACGGEFKVILCDHPIKHEKLICSGCGAAMFTSKQAEDYRKSLIKTAETKPTVSIKRRKKND